MSNVEVEPCPYCGEILAKQHSFIARHGDSPEEWRHSNNPKCWNDSRVVLPHEIEMWNMRFLDPKLADKLHLTLQNLKSQQIETPPEIRKLVADRFWDML